MNVSRASWATAVPARVTRPPIVQGTGAGAPSDGGLRAPHTPASSARET